MLANLDYLARLREARGVASAPSQALAVTKIVRRKESVTVLLTNGRITAKASDDADVRGVRFEQGNLAGPEYVDSLFGMSDRERQLSEFLADERLLATTEALVRAAGQPLVVAQAGIKQDGSPYVHVGSVLVVPEDEDDWGIQTEYVEIRGALDASGRLGGVCLSALDSHAPLSPNNPPNPEEQAWLRGPDAERVRARLLGVMHGEGRACPSSDAP